MTLTLVRATMKVERILHCKVLTSETATYCVS